MAKQSSTPELKFELKPDEIPRAEYDYIAQSAFQANEDRARVASFYFVTVGSLVAAILGAKYLEGQYDPKIVQFGFGGLFLLLTILGFLTTSQLARLRSAWYESALAMNQIKKFYTERFAEWKLEDAFLWRSLENVPKFKPKSVSFSMTLEVALLSAVTFGVSMFFLLAGWGCGGTWQWLIAIGSGLLIGLAQILVYRFILREKAHESKNQTN